MAIADRPGKGPENLTGSLRIPVGQVVKIVAIKRQCLSRFQGPRVSGTRRVIEQRHLAEKGAAFQNSQTRRAGLTVDFYRNFAIQN